MLAGVNHVSLVPNSSRLVIQSRHRFLGRDGHRGPGRPAALDMVDKVDPEVDKIDLIDLIDIGRPGPENSHNPGSTYGPDGPDGRRPAKAPTPVDVILGLFPVYFPPRFPTPTEEL